MKRIALAVALASVALLGPTGARAEVVELSAIEEPTNDWGRTQDPEIYPVGDALGQELVGAAIGNDTPGVADFIIRVKSLPAPGGAPEVTRYTWDARVNGKAVQLDGKYTNYSRGACDPTGGKCGVSGNPTGNPPVVTITGPRDPGPQPFFVRGDCVTNAANVRTCQEKAIVAATFDVEAATITIPVPLALLGVTEGCATIAPAGPNDNIFAADATISAAPSAFVTYGGSPADWIVLDAELDIATAC